MFKSLMDKFGKKRILYYPGCITKFKLPHLVEKYEAILQKMGIDYIRLDNLMKCCGSPALDAGYREDFENIKEKNKDLLKQYKIGKVITNCPACMRVFKEEYGLDVEHISQTIANSQIPFESTTKEKVVYFDSCILSKNNITEEPRDVLKNAGIKLAEFEKNRKKQMCCGAGGLLISNFPKLANEIAKKRLAECPSNTHIIVTACPLCYIHLKENTKELKIYDLSEMIK